MHWQYRRNMIKRSNTFGKDHHIHVFAVFRPKSSIVGLFSFYTHTETMIGKNDVKNYNFPDVDKKKKTSPAKNYFSRGFQMGVINKRHAGVINVIYCY